MIMDSFMLICIGMAVIGIVIVAAHFLFNGKDGRKLYDWIIKNGVRTEATIKQITTTSDGLLTPVVRFVVKWGFEDKAILFYCNKNGFTPEEYPEMLGEGKTVNIIYHPNDFDSLFIDMGDGTYFGQCRPQMRMPGFGIGLVIMAPVLYFALVGSM